MLRLLSDEDIPTSIISGLRKREAGLDVVRVQEVGLRTAEDPIILKWAAAESRVLITRDRQSMIGHAYDRVASGELMPGLIVLAEDLSTGQAIDQILMAAVCCSAEEVRDRVIFLPL
jgi:predicted nuclease of predicted toxin-antitoxin system